MSTDGGGWTVFQRRQDGSQNFYLGWSAYKAGFGDLDGEFWLGLDKIHRLSQSGQNILRVDLMDFNGAERYAKYGTFSVADESDKYKLQIGSYSGIQCHSTFSCQNVAMRQLNGVHTKIISVGWTWVQWMFCVKNVSFLFSYCDFITFSSLLSRLLYQEGRSSTLPSQFTPEFELKIYYEEISNSFLFF